MAITDSIHAGNKVVAIASSTGGPKALQAFLPLLPGNLNAPVLIVQHMPSGFTKALAERLDQMSALSVKEAEEGDILKKGCVYIAKGGSHMTVVKHGHDHRIHYIDDPPREGVKPCANFMYESLIDSSYDSVVCAVLTGMGMDGTVGIKNLKQKKPIVIYVQDKESSTVFGMPGSIVREGLVSNGLPLPAIAHEIAKNVGVN